MFDDELKRRIAMANNDLKRFGAMTDDELKRLDAALDDKSVWRDVDEAYRRGFETARMLAITLVNVRVPLAQQAARDRTIAALQAMKP